MRSVAIGLLLGAVTLMIGLVVFGGGAGEARTYYSPDTYVEKADRLIREGKLVAHCPDGYDKRQIKFLETAATEAEQTWYRVSYLSSDVARFNRDPRYHWTFVVEEPVFEGGECRLTQINASIRNVDLPFAGHRAWGGGIFYSGAYTGARLRSATRTVGLLPPGGGDKASSALCQNLTLSGDEVLLHSRQGRSQSVARLYSVGEATVLESQIGSDDMARSVRLMGYEVRGGTRARLKSGDWFHLREPGCQETFVYEGGGHTEENTSFQGLPVASAVRRQNDHLARTFGDDLGLGWSIDPLSDTSVTYIELITRQINRALRELDANTEVVGDFDIQLTIRPGMQQALSSLLHQASDKKRQVYNLNQPFSAGVTVMDGKRGDVLAAATYPWPEDATSLRGAERRRLLQNQNFLLHPIGSAIKPFLYAAIGYAYPALLDLEIAHHGSTGDYTDLLGCKLDNGYRLLASGGNGYFGMPYALKRSSNKYTIELLTLALAMNNTDGRRWQDALGDKAWSGPNRPRIKGTQLAAYPDLSKYLSGRACNDFRDAEGLRYWDDFMYLTGIDDYRGRLRMESGVQKAFYLTYLEESYDLSHWGLVLEQLDRGTTNKDVRWEMRRDLAALSPEKANLEINHFRLLREQYISLALGGASAAGSNLQMAEALARLVVGHQVQGHIVAALHAEETGLRRAPGTATLGLDPARFAAARETVLEGLRQVGEMGGTAGRIRSRLDELRRRYPNDTLYLFSKTGTPTREIEIPPIAGQVLRRWVETERLSQSRSNLILRQNGAEFPYRGKRGDPEFRQALFTALRASGVAPGQRRSTANALIDIFDQFLVQERATGELIEVSGEAGSPLLVEAGRLRIDPTHPFFASGRKTADGAIYIFALVKIPNAIARGVRIPSVEQIAHPETEVRTVAIHLFHGKEGSPAAVTVAMDILRHVALF